MLTSPPGYLRAVRELCSKYNVLMIADEVATGFGKTGAMFACDREGVAPEAQDMDGGVVGPRTTAVRMTPRCRSSSLFTW